MKGLLHAHVGWLFIHTQRGAKERYAPDLIKDPVISFVDRTFLVWALGGLAVAFVLGFAIGGTFDAGLTGLLWGGGVRMLVLHHVTYSINSLCHFFGRRDFATPRRVAQPLVAGAADVRRVLAQQPPCLPDLGGARAAQARDRHLRDGDPSARVRRARVGRGAHRSCTPALEGRRRDRLALASRTIPRVPFARTAPLAERAGAGAPRAPLLGVAVGRHAARRDQRRRPDLPRPLARRRRARAAGTRAARARARLRLRRARGRRSRRRARDARPLAAAAARPQRADAAAARRRAGLRRCACRRGAPAAELRPSGRRHSRARDARAVRHHYDLPPEFFALFLGPVDDVQLRAVLARRVHARGGAGAEARARVPQARAAARRARARHRMRLGQLRDPRGREARRARHRDHALRAAGRACAPPRRRARPGGPGRHPRRRLPRARRRALRRDRQHRDGGARRCEPHRPVRAADRPLAAPRRAAPQPRHHPPAARRPRGRAVLGAVRVPGRGPSAPLAHPARARARRPRHRPRRGTSAGLRDHPDALAARARGPPRRCDAPRRPRARARVAPLPEDRAQGIRDRLPVDLSGARPAEP